MILNLRPQFNRGSHIEQKKENDMKLHAKRTGADIVAHGNLE